MKTLFVACFMILSLCATMAMGADLKGTISDAKCAKAHADASEKSMKCVNACVKKGVAPVLVTEDGKILKIHNADSVNDHLGHKVTVSGKVDGDSIHIDKVTM